jgi:hypothetical protein
MHKHLNAAVNNRYALNLKFWRDKPLRRKPLWHAADSTGKTASSAYMSATKLSQSQLCTRHSSQGLVVCSITKTFVGTRALADVFASFPPVSIMALLGQRPRPHDGNERRRQLRLYQWI